jgi:hypothetical protein
VAKRTLFGGLDDEQTRAMVEFADAFNACSFLLVDVEGKINKK